MSHAKYEKMSSALENFQLCVLGSAQMIMLIRDQSKTWAKLLVGLNLIGTWLT